MNFDYFCKDKTNHNRVLVIGTPGFSQTFPGTATFTKLTIYNNVKKDNYSQWDNSNSRFTAKYAGNYAVNAKVLFSPSVNTGQRVLLLFKNGVSFVSLGFIERIAGSVGNYFSVEGNTEVNLVPGDYLEIFTLVSVSPETTHTDPTFNQLTITQLSSS